jgi:hypothetical protein
MRWEEARSQWLDKLVAADQLLSKATALTILYTGVAPELKEALASVTTRVRQQSHKLEVDLFDVAVIGLEKAGKSTLLNGWLGINLLPSRLERCTYTTTQIESAVRDDEQEYDISYYTTAELQQQLADARATLGRIKEQQLGDRQKLAKEVDELERLMPQLTVVAGGGHKKRAFRTLTEVQRELQEAIADPAYARAVKRLIIRTSLVREHRNIVFHDVPGFNSPVASHQNQALDRIRDADAILYCKKTREPDLVDSEVAMLREAGREDHVRLGDKLIVALTYCDDLGDYQHFNEAVDISRCKWEDLGVPRNRVIPVCAPAELFRLGAGDENVMRLGPEQMQKLVRLRRMGKAEATGLGELKEVVNHYLDVERGAVLSRKCAGLLEEADEHCTALVNAVRQRFPGDYQDTEAYTRIAFDQAFMEWWLPTWREILVEFRNYYDTYIRPRKRPDDVPVLSERLVKFQEEFTSGIDAFIANIPVADSEWLTNVYKTAAGPDGVIVPLDGHAAIRRAVAEQALAGLDNLVIKQVNCLEYIIDDLVSWLRSRLWNVPGLEEELVRCGAVRHSRFEQGMSALFLRFARPAIHLFLYYPRESRAPLIDQYRKEVAILNEHFEADDADKRSLEAYLRSGIWRLATDAVAGGRSSGSFLEQLGERRHDVKNHFESATAEIRSDVTALAQYLKHSVFHAAGFVAFCHQEADHLRRHIETEAREMNLHLLIKRAYYNRYEPLIQGVPRLEEHMALRRDISRQLRELQQDYETLFASKR